MSEHKDYNKFLKKSIDLKNIREERRREISKDDLFKSCKKKIQTTMIGALDTIEKQFGFLWSFEDQDSLNEEQKQIKNIYDEVRANILDKGNTQIRNLEAEFANYEVSRKRYHLDIPVVNPVNVEVNKNSE
jgi:transcription termination factor Rho